MWGGTKKSKIKAKEEIRDQKVSDSQKALMHAAISTADMAADVTRTMRKRMEDAIRQFETTARIMNDGLLICDLEGTVQAWNGAAELMFGLISETPVVGLFEFAGRPLVNSDELYTVVKAKKRPLVGKHVDGTLFPLNARMTILERSDGSTMILLAAQDMTVVSKHIDGKFDASAVALGTGEIVAANPGVQRLFGYSPEEILGRNVSTVMKSVDRHGAHLNLIFEVARMQWMGEEAVLITMREAGATKRAVSRVKRDNGVDMVCTYGSDFKITSANAMFLKAYGLKKKTTIGSDIREYMPYDEVDDFTAGIRCLTVEDSFYRSHYVDTKEDNTQAVQDWIDHAIFDPIGALIEIHRSGRDIGLAVAKAKAKRDPQ